MSSINSKMGEIAWTWSDLPEELVDLVANNLSNNVELRRIRSICKPWRSALAIKKRFPDRCGRMLCSFSNQRRTRTRLFPTTLFRVTLPSSCSSKGWLIRTSKFDRSSNNILLSPLSRQLITPSDQTIDLLKFAVSEISQSYEIEYLFSQDTRSDMSSRVVFLDSLFFAVDVNQKIWCCNDGEESKGWTRINKQVENIWGTNKVDDVTDIILHKGHVYALDLSGGIWWISLSTLSTVQYAPSTPSEYYEIDSCKEKRLVEYCGDLCVVHRFCKRFCVEGGNIERTIDFKVFKMDEASAEWVMISSLGDKALIMAVDICFTVGASEYYGCLANSIYFTDAVEDRWSIRTKVEDVKVFKLDDGSIINMTDSSNSQSCFHLFSPPFL